MKTIPLKLRSMPVAALAWLLILTIGTLVAGVIPVQISAPLLMPDTYHILGTDWMGRDVFLRMLQGGGRSVLVAGIGCLLAVVAGGAWGVLSGYVGGGWERFLTRMMDAALAFPSLFAALIILAAMGPGEGIVAFSIGIGGVAMFARLARAETIQVRNRGFLQASRAIGAGPLRLLFRHIVPNIALPLGAYTAVQFGWMLANASALTFLGFGGSPSTADWGRMLGEARLVFWQAPWQAVAPGIAIAGTVLAVQKLGEWLLENRSDA